MNAVLDYRAEHPQATYDEVAQALTLQLATRVTTVMVKKRVQQLRDRQRIRGRTVIQRELWPAYLLVDVAAPKLGRVTRALRQHAVDPELVQVKGVDLNCTLLVITKVLDEPGLDALRRECANAGAFQTRGLIGVPASLTFTAI